MKLVAVNSLIDVSKADVPNTLCEYLNTTDEEQKRV